MASDGGRLLCDPDRGLFVSTGNAVTRPVPITRGLSSAAARSLRYAVGQASTSRKFVDRRRPVSGGQC
jgi:hypothetical protein